MKGMVIGSKVNFQGVPIGMVQDIRFQGGKTLVEVTVDPRRADIQDVTLARLDRLLVTGQVTVELEGWGEGRSLVPGEYIQTKTDPINQLTKTLPELVPQIGSVLERIDSMLNQCNAFLDEDNRGHVAAILKSTDATLAALPAAIEQGRSLMSRADAVLTELEATSFAIRTEVTAVGGESRAMIAAVRAPLQSAIANARGSLDELRGFMRQLRLAPDSLLFGVNRPAAPAGSER